MVRKHVSSFAYNNGGSLSSWQIASLIDTAFFVTGVQELEALNFNTVYLQFIFLLLTLIYAGVKVFGKVS